MNVSGHSRRHARERQGLHRAIAPIVLVYLLVSAGWIYGSDHLIASLVSERSLDVLTQAQTLKGWFFVVVTAALLYLLIWRMLNRRAREREAADEALRRSEQRFFTAARCSSDLIYEIDLATGWMELFGDPGEGLGSGLRQMDELRKLIHPDDRERVELARQQAVKRGQPFQVSYRMRRRDGDGYREWVDRGVVQHAPDGTSRAIVGAAADVTDAHVAERERAALQQQIQHVLKMDALGRLAGGVGHDFNNLLTVILGNASLLKESVPVGHPTENLVSEIQLAANQAADLTRRLLALCRKEIIEPHLLHPNNLIEQTRPLLERVLGPSIELHLSLDPAAPLIKADPGQLEQTLVNLALNARDAMPAGGRLSIETARDGIGSARPGTAVDVPPGEYLQLTVNDTGSGMTEDVRARCFEPFFTTKPDGRGTGLGLASVYGAVTQNGGAISVDSVPGGGCKFTILWPASEEADALIEPPSGPNPAGGAVSSEPSAVAPPSNGPA